MNDVTHALQDLIGIFDELALPYAVIGGTAVSAYGIPRTSDEFDFMLAVPRDRLTELCAIVEHHGYTVPANFRAGWVDAIAGMPLVKFRLERAGRGVDVDVFLAESPFQQEVLLRRQFAETIDGTIWLASPEDLVLLKLLAFRPRDVLDILDVLFTQGQLDENYLQRWAKQLGITGRLDEVLTKSRDMA